MMDIDLTQNEWVNLYLLYPTSKEYDINIVKFNPRPNPDPTQDACLYYIYIFNIDILYWYMIS